MTANTSEKILVLSCGGTIDKDYPMEGRWQIADEKYQRCPLSILDDNFLSWGKAYGMFKNGMLPNSGGWLDQSNKYIEMMLYMDCIISKNNNEKVNNGKK